MDPVSIGFVACKIFFRLWARAEYKDAFEDQHSARQAYEYSRRRALQEQEKCIEGCIDLANNRKAVLDGRWGELHTFLVASGVNGGLFAPPRRVFGNRSEEDVRAIISSLQLLDFGVSHSNMNATHVMMRSALLLRGISWLDLPILHDSLHDTIISLSPEAGGKLAGALGGFGDIEIGDYLDGALTIGSFAMSGMIIAEASECRTRTLQLRQETQRLDGQWAKLEAANQRIALLLAELDECSYQLFKWTVASQEAARIQREAHGKKRNVSDLPRWVLTGLLRKATELWSTLDKQIF